MNDHRTTNSSRPHAIASPRPAVCRTPRSVWEFLKYFLVLTDVLNNVGTMCVSENERASGATMTTTLMEQLNTGDVIEMKTNDNDVITVLVLLATDDALVLDPCNGDTPFVLRSDELVEYRKFDAEAMFADA